MIATYAVFSFLRPPCRPVGQGTSVGGETCRVSARGAAPSWQARMDLCRAPASCMRTDAWGVRTCMLHAASNTAASHAVRLPAPSKDRLQLCMPAHPATLSAAPAEPAQPHLATRRARTPLAALALPVSCTAACTGCWVPQSSGRTFRGHAPALDGWGPARAIRHPGPAQMAHKAGMSTSARIIIGHCRTGAGADECGAVHGHGAVAHHDKQLERIACGTVPQGGATFSLSVFPQTTHLGEAGPV